MSKNLKKGNFTESPYFKLKLTQLYEMIIVRHGVMVVGLPFSTKSTTINILAETLGDCAIAGIMEEKKVEICTMNPKSLKLTEFYGNFDEISHDWFDGVLATWFRKFADPEALQNRRWLLFDGPVDTLWIESMNTVLDDSKKLCLNSGEVI